MRILVGVLYSGEPQFQDCIAAIKTQTHQDWDYFVIENLPNREAHQKLFSTFNERANEFDLFVKIDADMELCNNDFFTALIDYFEDNPHIEHVSMKVDDFYTAKLIWGMNAFRSSVRFGVNDEVYTDKAIDIPRQKRSHLKRHSILVPAARHAYSPSEYQAFYFGCHKAVKVMARQSRSHMRNIRRLLFSAILKRDKRHLIAYAGAAIAFEQRLDAVSLDHANGTVENIFEQLKNHDHLFWLKNLYRHNRIVTQARKEYLAGNAG